MDSEAFLHLEQTTESMIFLLCKAEATGKACWMAFQANILTLGGSCKAQKNFHQPLELSEFDSMMILYVLLVSNNVCLNQFDL